MSRQEELEAMSDGELNLLLAKKTFPECEYEIIGTSNIIGLIDEDSFCNIDYCNNYNDTMPLVVENRVSLIFPEEVDWFIAEKVLYPESPLSELSCTDTNPLRAAVIVLILILESGNDY